MHVRDLCSDFQVESLRKLEYANKQAAEKLAKAVEEGGELSIWVLGTDIALQITIPYTCI